MTGYILQIILFQLLFLLVYELLLKKETFFGYNRWYLLLGSVISLLLPLIKIEAFSTLVPAESIAGLTKVWLPEVFIGNAPENIQHLSAVDISRESTNINWWLVAYGIGIFGSLFLLFRKYWDLNKLFRFKTISSERDFKIIEVPNSGIACTFYKTIFLGEKLTETEKQQILSHELVHVKQKHSLDLVYFELLKIVFWFNPLVYIYQSKIAALHEFIADAAVVKTTEKRSYYEQLLNSAFNTQNISFINQFFNHSLIKKRIVMLQKSKSKTIAKFKFLVLVPLMMLMLTYVACSDENKLSSDNPNLGQYSYTLIGGDEKSSEKDAKSYETFLMENPGYVGWKIVDHDKEIIEYSIHSEDEKVPEDFIEYHLNLPNGQRSTHYVKEIGGEQRIKDLFGTDGAVPFAVIDQAPVFPGCEDLGSNGEQKKCFSEKLTEFVIDNFNTGLGKELGLKGVNRVIVQFKIDTQGNITDVKSRAPHPALEEEALRVINSLPQMHPGEHGGKNVGVMYSLPIVFQVNE